MEKSEQINELAKALCVFQSECPEIELNSEVSVKTKSGGAYSFKYSTLNNVLKAIKPILKKAGLSYSQLPEDDNSITTILMHESGQYLQGNKPLDLPNNVTAQEVGSFITYFKRYSLLAMLGVVAEDDEDGNIASGNTAKKKEITEWMNNSQFTQVFNSDKATIQKALDYYNGQDGKGMKKEYRKELEVKLKTL